MSLRALLGTRPTLEPAALDRIADAVEAVTSARLSSTTVYAGDRGNVVVQGEGYADYSQRLTFVHYQVDGKIFDELQAGPDILFLLSLQEQQETGKLWKWMAEAPSNWDCARAQTVATLRHRARPIASTVEELDGDEVYRHSLLIKPGRGERDPLLAGSHEHLQRRGVKRLTFDVWLSRDGQLRRTREHAIMFRTYARPGQIVSVTVDNRDFGIAVAGLTMPTPHQVLRQEPKAAGLTVIIDGQTSPY
jgi:hypothetical protein